MPTGSAVFDRAAGPAGQGRLHHPLLPHADGGQQPSVDGVDARGLQRPRVQVQEELEGILHHPPDVLDQGLSLSLSLSLSLFDLLRTTGIFEHLAD